MCTTFVDIDSCDDEAFDAWEAVSADVKELEIRYLEAADIAREQGQGHQVLAICLR